MSELNTLLEFARAGQQPAGKLLLVLDENAAHLPPPPQADALALCNRIDIHDIASQATWQSLYSDFDFSAPELAGTRLACYRISKEKRVVEHVLQALWALLPVGGELVCAGYKNEGVKTFAKRLQAASGSAPVLERGEQQFHMYRFTKHDTAFTPLNDSDYHALQAIGQWQGHELWSKPGIFAWDRLDAGSLFLLEQLPLLKLKPGSLQCGLDLGCGYGLLALALLQMGCRQVVATDNNAAAVRACTHNLQQWLQQQNGEHQKPEQAQTVQVLAADCGQGIRERSELILCNPPFHQGFAVEQSLSDSFLQTPRRLLRSKGQALFVVNTFIPLERKAAALFADVQTLADNRHFKVIRLAKPLR